MKNKLISVLAAVCLFASQSFLHASVVLGVNKTAFEAFNLAVDFTPVIGSDGLTITGVSSYLTPNNLNSTSQIIAKSPAPLLTSESALPASMNAGSGTESDVVVIRIQGGQLNQTHTVDVQVTDNVTGEQYEGQVTLHITSAP